MNSQGYISQKELDNLINTHTLVEEPKKCIKKRIAKVIANEIQTGHPIKSQYSIIESVTNDISQLFKKNK